MKVGPLTIERSRPGGQQPKQTPRPDYEEIGAPGTLIFGGWMQTQDYNPDLQAPACYDVYDKMRLGDGQVRAGLTVVKLPILRAHWEVVPGSDSAQDRMIAEFIDRDLQSMSIAYISFLRQALLMLDYGCMLFEKCWRLGEDDGLIHLRKLAPRLPKSVIFWCTDENGGFDGVKQGAIKASGYELVDIPQEKLLLFVNEQEGANFRGISMLRAAYKHWFFKDGLYRVDAIAKEKRGVGVDVGTIKPNAANRDDLKTSLERALATLHAHQKQYFIEDEENYTYRLETGQARVTDALPSIEHHDLRILRSILAEFLNMGSNSTGSLAMHKDKSSFFLMALEATADLIAETLSTHLLKQWVDYNWRVSDYPRIKYSRLDSRDLASIATAVQQLVSVGALTPNPATEAELRVLADLPDTPGEEQDPGEGPTVDETPPIAEKIAAAVAGVQARQIARIQAEIAAGKAVEEIDVPYRREVSEAIVAVLKEEGMQPRLAVRQARALANILADRLRGEAVLADADVIGRGLAAVA